LIYQGNEYFQEFSLEDKDIEKYLQPSNFEGFHDETCLQEIRDFCNNINCNKENSNAFNISISTIDKLHYKKI
jgi:hypothetical protein